MRCKPKFSGGPDIESHLLSKSRSPAPPVRRPQSAPIRQDGCGSACLLRGGQQRYTGLAAADARGAVTLMNLHFAGAAGIITGTLLGALKGWPIAYRAILT